MVRARGRKAGGVYSAGEWGSKAYAGMSGYSVFVWEGRKGVDPGFTVLGGTSWKGTGFA